MTPVAFPGVEDTLADTTFLVGGDAGGVECAVEGGVVEAGVVVDWSDSDVFPPPVFNPSDEGVEGAVDAGGKTDRVNLGTLLPSVTATPVEGNELFASSLLPGLSSALPSFPAAPP